MTAEANEKSLVALIEAARENANQRISDKQAIGVSDYKRIEAYRMKQVINGCRENPCLLADMILEAMPYPYGRDITDVQIDELAHHQVYIVDGGKRLKVEEAVKSLS